MPIPPTDSISAAPVLSGTLPSGRGGRAASAHWTISSPTSSRAGRVRRDASGGRREVVGRPCLADIADIDLIGFAEIPDAHDGADTPVGKPDQIEKRERREMH